MTWLLASWQSIHILPCLCYGFTKCQLMCAKNRSCCSPPQQEWPQPWPGAFLSRVEMVHVREPFQPQLLSPLRWKSVPWSARNESFGDANLSNSPQLAVTVTHCQPELDLRNQILVNGYWKLFFCSQIFLCREDSCKYQVLKKGKSWIWSIRLCATSSFQVT